MPQNAGRTVHKSVTHDLPLGPSGRCKLETLKEIFCCMLLSFENSESQVPGRLKAIIKSSHPFSFTPEEGLDHMKSLTVQIPRGTMSAEFSFSVQSKELGESLLSQFFEAHFLHCPGDRTRSVAAPTVLLQPTPKGLWVLAAFVRKHAMNYAPEILKSGTSLECFELERSENSDRLYAPNNTLRLLFSCCMGQTQNFWSYNTSHVMLKPAVLVEPVPSSEVFDFGAVSFQDLIMDVPLERSKSLDYTRVRSLDYSRVRQPRSRSKDVDASPEVFLGSKFFTNPDSTAHFQYFSTQGVRMFKSRKLADGRVVGPCFTGKALCQWLTDCTDAVNMNEARSLGKLFYEKGFIKSVSGDEMFLSGPQNAYFLTEKGLAICQWESQITDKTPTTYKLSDVFKDRVLRDNFKKYLHQQLSLENFEAYFMIRQFSRNLTCLKKKICKLKQYNKSKSSKLEYTLKSTTNYAAQCISLGYRIYSTFIAAQSPSEVNIDYNLRAEISKVMMSYKDESNYGLESSNDTNSIISGKSSSSESSETDLKKLDVKYSDCLYNEAILNSDIEFLNTMNPLFQTVSKVLYSLMEKSSLPRFSQSL